MSEDKYYKQAVGGTIPEAYTPAKGGLLPEPQPVAYINVEERKLEWAKPTRWKTPTVVKTDNIPLYLVPPKREWVDLTEEETNALIYTWARELVFEVEAKLKEKNNG